MLVLDIWRVVVSSQSTAGHWWVGGWRRPFVGGGEREEGWPLRFAKRMASRCTLVMLVLLQTTLLCTEIDAVSDSICFTGIQNVNIALRLLLSPRGLVISHTCTRQGQAQETSRLLDVRGKIMDHLAVDAVQRPVTVPVERIESLHHSYCIRLLPTQIRSSSHLSLIVHALRSWNGS